MTRRRTVVVGLGFLVLAGVVFWWLTKSEHARGEHEHDRGDASAFDAGVTGQAGASVSNQPPTRPASADSGTPPLPVAANVIATFGWGSGDEALGRERQQEGNAEGPMSLTVAPDGTIVILDQVNQRLVKLDASGKRVGSTPIPVQAAQDVLVTKDGTSLVLDRLVDRTVAIIGPDGKPRGELPIEGKGMAEGGASTGLFNDGDDVLVEREHGDLVRIGKTDGKADTERGEVPGRPSKDGANYLTALIASAADGLVAVTAVAKSTLEHRFTRQLSFGQPIVQLVMLDSDATGIGFVGANVELPGSTPEQPKVGVVVLCLDGRDGAVLGRAVFSPNTVADETFRELTVSGDGSILFLRRTEQGAQLERHRCQ